MENNIIELNNDFIFAKIEEKWFMAKISHKMRYKVKDERIIKFLEKMNEDDYKPIQNNKVALNEFLIHHLIFIIEGGEELFYEKFCNDNKQ